MNSAHIHMIIVHLPIVGATLSIIPMMWGWVRNNHEIQKIGLSLLGISLLGMPIAIFSGEATFEKFITGTISPDIDTGGAHYAFLHYQAAEFVSKIGYFALILVCWQIFLGRKIRHYKKHLFLTTLILNAVLIIGFGYVGYLGGKIRHPEVRTETYQPITSGTIAESEKTLQ